jgi:hypothetical protein
MICLFCLPQFASVDEQYYDEGDDVTKAKNHKHK